MANIFEEPIYLAPTATAISVGVTIVLWLVNTRDKKLSLEILSDTPLVTSSEELVEHVHIFSAGDEVRNVRLIEAKIVNAGHVPIRVSDYAEKISLEFTDGKVLSAHVMESLPESLANNTKDGAALVEEVRENGIIFKPVLLNPGNYFLVKVFVCSSSSSSPVLKGHIEGIKHFQEFKESKLPKGLLVHAGAFIMIGAVYFFDPRSLVEGPLVAWVPNVLFFMFGYLMLLASFYDQKKRARWTKS